MAATQPKEFLRMSNLVAIAYPDRATAEEVMATLGRLQTEHAIELEDAVVVTRDDQGKVKLHQSSKLAVAGAAGGALWGGLIGLIFFVPLLGMAVGAATGAATGALTDVGVDDQFMKDLGAKLTLGSAALIVLVHSSTPDKVLPEIAQFGGDVSQTSLATEAEARLRHVLEARDAAAVSGLRWPGEGVARRALPAWLSGYRRDWLRRDVVAGVVVWSVVVPQAVAYGQIAGLPPEAGLMAAPGALVAYALLGTSRTLIVSATTATSALSAAAVGPLAGGDPVTFAALSAALAILAGGILIAGGLLGLGAISDFVSKPVMTGFLFGLGLTIILAQLGSLLGVDAG